ncbi:class I SAM-dependent methyltransferase [Vibrio sp. Sgm 22]|uniref:class I SAM-dependent methyltransferase n=1 Tax=unclassified Vibrio TaxID=2614977 RepID=UPI0022494241|nr:MULTISPECIES: class I SAM-dependent methyltransferase [unclassified Vibrio]MCX2758974.1 class I SAM-dependent methyltransferase [Vibrio sp. 14G-20]MCX2774434.1 class I SAM-dependent methyltransferase [Vibrio sp. Sgm 22]
MTYYDQKAQEFFDGTINVDMTSLYSHFIPLIPEGGLVLDAGCGSGRDSKAFKQRGFKVHAIDASEVLGRLAEDKINQKVEITTFQQFTSSERFDAIWACASLLHVPMSELPSAFNNLSNYLKPKGAFYCSFKYGNDEVERNGRQFTNLNESLLDNVISDSGFTVMKIWCTSDLRKGRDTEKWLNAILLKD